MENPGGVFFCLGKRFFLVESAHDYVVQYFHAGEGFDDLESPGQPQGTDACGVLQGSNVPALKENPSLI